MQEENAKQTSAPEIKVTLSRPLPDGRTEVVLDFERVTGHVLIQCEKDAKKDDPSMLVPALSQSYQARIAAVAGKVKIDDILDLPADDFTAMTITVQSFLTHTGRQA